MQNRTEQPHPHLAGLPVFLRAPRATGLWLIGVLITLATIVAFGLSYRGLFLWAAHHQWPPPWPAFFPLLIDVLIVVCEVILFVAAIDGDTPWRVRALAWVTLLVFTAASIVANADHIAVADWPTRAGFGLPPLVLAVALGFGLGELKRQAAKYRNASPAASAGASAAARLPSLREIQARQNCGQETAKKIRAEIVRVRAERLTLETSRGGAVHGTKAAAPAATDAPAGWHSPAGVSVPAGETPLAPAGTYNNGQAHGR